MKKRQTEKHWSKSLWQLGACYGGVAFAEKFTTPGEAYLSAALACSSYFSWGLAHLLGMTKASLLLTCANRKHPDPLRRNQAIVTFLQLVPDRRDLSSRNPPWEITEEEIRAYFA